MTAKKSISALEKRISELEKENAAIKENLSFVRKGKQSVYRDLAEVLPEALFELDTKGNIVVANKHAFDLLTLSEDEFKNGIKFVDLIIDEDRKRAQINLAAHFKGEEIQGEEYKILRKDRQIISVLFYTTLLYDKEAIAGLRCILFNISKSKITEEALIRVNDHFEATLNALPDLLYEISFDYKILDFRDPDKEYRKEKEKTLINQPIDRLFSAEQLAIIKQTIKNVKKNWKTIRIEYQTITKSGLRFFEATFSPKGEKNNTKSTVIVLARDITKRKIAEQKLSASETNFRTLTNTLKSAIFIIQEDKFLYINKAGEDIIGYTLDELKNVSFWDLIHPDYIDVIRQRELTRKSGESIPSRFEFAIINPTKGVRWLDYSTSVFEYHGKLSILGTGFDITDKKLAQKALSESEERYKNLIDGSAEGILVAELDSAMFYYANPAICKLLGYTREELLTLGVKDIHPKEDLPYVISQFEAQARGEIIIAYNTPCLRKDGQIRYVNISTSPQVIDGIKSNVGFFQDITEHKKAIQDLQESEQKYNNIVENASDGIIVIQNKKLIFYNSKALNLIGFSAEEVEKRDFLEFLHPDDRMMVAERLTRRIKGEKVNNIYEFRIINSKQEVIWIQINSALIDWQGSPAVLSFFSDISQRKETEAALLIELSINQAIAHLATELLSPKLSIEKIADIILNYAEKITGSKHGFISIIEKDDQSNVIMACNSNLEKAHSQNGRPISFQKTKDGYLGLLGHSLNTNKAFFTNDPATHPSHSNISVDHVPIKNFLAVPAFFNNELLGEIAVADSEDGYCNRDLENIQRLAPLFAIAINRKQSDNELLKAKQKAIESDQLKTAFLENMSHEIRTPMNGIVGFSELLLEPEITRDKISEYLDYISNSSKVLLKLIDDIIDISKIEAGQLTITKSNFSLVALLRELLSIFNKEKEIMGKGNIDLRLSLPSGISDFEINTDPLRLRQILTNLLGNALKYTDTGFIEFGFTSENNKSLLFYVKDTGLGLPKDKQKIIFDRFRQVNETPTKKTSGTGLGLSISKNLVDLLNGKIWVKSSLHQGSTFFFTLPVLVSEIVTISVKKEYSNIVSYDWEERKILIVEDEETNMRLIKAVLASTKATILSCVNGKDAVELCKQDSGIDLVLMDIQLPVMNGYDATRLIKKENSNLPIIAQTAYAMSDEKHKIMKAGFTDYIVKPLKKNNLLSLIDRYLQ